MFEQFKEYFNTPHSQENYKIVSTQSGGSASYYESSTVSQFPTYLESILVGDVCLSLIHI